MVSRMLTIPPSFARPHAAPPRRATLGTTARRSRLQWLGALVGKPAATLALWSTPDITRTHSRPDWLPAAKGLPCHHAYWGGGRELCTTPNLLANADSASERPVTFRHGALRGHAGTVCFRGVRRPSWPELCAVAQPQCRGSTLCSRGKRLRIPGARASAATGRERRSPRAPGRTRPTSAPTS